ncbi:hypothetical protein LSH36_521g01010 [Paralvinella palmiformis]|uniref:Ankyrin repeat protein n=1 Tax=Paralvinella palmiformis TaxID=53620 RepID=A0AAD9J817_9ANNE|nr:hypothetical protein LSH36_521g01010 [Paralvinella palmiformis]
MCNEAGEEAHAAMLFHLLEDDNTEGFLSYLGMYSWNEQILLPCLHACLRDRRWLCVEALVDHGARCDQYSLDLLNKYLAESEGDQVLDVLEECLCHGLDIDQCTRILFTASANGHVDIVSYLLSLGCDPNVQFANDLYRNRTCLIASTVSSYDRVSELFLDHPDTNLALYDKNGMTALHVAVESCRHELMHRYIERCPSVMEFRNFLSNTPLQMAILRGCDVCVRILAEHGADLNAQSGNANCNIFSTTPLMLSIARQADEITEFLIGHPQCDINVVDASTGMTALHRAADIGALHVVRLLLKNGACANPADQDLATPLLLAINERHVAVALELLPYLGSPDPNGTILKMALERGLLVLLEPLIYLGARILDLFNQSRSKEFAITPFSWQQFTSKPKSLKHQVMLLIRKTLNTVTEVKVSSLRLPRQLGEFILVRKWMAKLADR